MSNNATPKPGLNDTQVVTCECRMSYVNLFEAKKISESDKEAKFSVTILIPKNTDAGVRTHKAIMAAIGKAAEKGAAKHFGGKTPPAPNHTLKDGDTEVDDMGELKMKKNPELAGHWYMRLSTKFAPKVFKQMEDGSRVPMSDPMDAYSGMYGKASLTTFAYSGDGRRGISAVLNNVLKTRDGEPLTAHLSGDEFGE